jgi:hypothetical protein
VQRQEEVIRASRDAASSVIIGRPCGAVVRFSKGTKQEDDLTAVIIKSL